MCPLMYVCMHVQMYVYHVWIALKLHEYDTGIILVTYIDHHHQHTEHWKCKFNQHLMDGYGG